MYLWKLVSFVLMLFMFSRGKHCAVWASEEAFSSPYAENFVLWSHELHFSFFSPLPQGHPAGKSKRSTLSLAPQLLLREQPLLIPGLFLHRSPVNHLVHAATSPNPPARRTALLPILCAVAGGRLGITDAPHQPLNSGASACHLGFSRFLGQEAPISDFRPYWATKSVSYCICVILESWVEKMAVFSYRRNQTIDKGWTFFVWVISSLCFFKEKFY